MSQLLLVVHLVIAVALVVVVLMQRSEGGALGIGGGASFTSGRSGGNPLTRMTALLGAAFFLSSIGLTVLARGGGESHSILDSAPTNVPSPAPLPEPVPGSAPESGPDSVPSPPAAPMVPLAE